MSARSITPSILRKLWEYNHQLDEWIIPPGETNRKVSKDTWGGGRTRRLLESAYTLAFWCLLRFDELTQIEISHIEVVSPTCIKLILPFRKTHQCGSESSTV